MLLPYGYVFFLEQEDIDLAFSVPAHSPAGRLDMIMYFTPLCPRRNLPKEELRFCVSKTVFFKHQVIIIRMCHYYFRVSATLHTHKEELRFCVSKTVFFKHRVILIRMCHYYFRVSATLHAHSEHHKIILSQTPPACKHLKRHIAQFLRVAQKIIVFFSQFVNCKKKNNMIYCSHRKGRYRPMYN